MNLTFPHLPTSHLGSIVRVALPVFDQEDLHLLKQSYSVFTPVKLPRRVPSYRTPLRTQPFLDRPAEGGRGNYWEEGENEVNKTVTIA